MGEQLKVSYEEVRKVVKGMNDATNAIQADTSKEIGSGNALEVVNKINEMNLMIQQLTEEYKAMLLDHNNKVEKSLDSLHQFDQLVTTYLQAFHKIK
ncbi:DUF5344 family protein [Metabacillus malikii]|uniref:Molybdenum-dependent DNA-binding transcriptional regulator ModE n=1 Tax=Metabacillus malikii TaxID=1504265 RepID=A0ABT9ZKI4_9BACI|nr:DUF5344 family protein [Metabacillus malikii]MDQ0232772.1 molybdenum-dependent DNA-binding transcriptional regulator ModE [Metabacillus malikii]